ncbi:MAG: ABC transporter ATP-binding protein [Clostridia bacterium]|nr:ABC transporter ATP-binding protein [Clostridia bacterium]NCC43695.1 ABC transporter ATP-binding protein [Clostridia bacterium]
MENKNIENMQMQIRQIHKKFRKKNVLEDISFTAKPGNCIGILGENGCGKSTLMSILSGVQKADGGSFTWDGHDLLKEKELRSRLVGYVPQGTPLMQELTALDNLKLWYECAGRDLDADLKRGVPLMLGVTEFLKVPVNKMSGGMKKRLSISCAVAHQPRILLLDEPSAALDLICKEKISNYFMDFKRRGGILLLATHDVQELPLCDSWYIMKNGKLVPYEYDGNIHTLVGKL